MDAVYVCRAGKNEALRYSLRSLGNVRSLDNVWIFGGWPEWVNTKTVRCVENISRAVSRYDRVTDHIHKACLDPRVSDPFMLWNDDFYAVAPTGPPLLHRGALADELKTFARERSEWGRSLRGTARSLERLDLGHTLLSYELHVPLIVWKHPMLDAIRISRHFDIGTACRRTVYGNLVNLGGTKYPDPKVSGYRWPEGPWVSSGVLNSRLLARLHELFPEPNRYETAL